MAIWCFIGRQTIIWTEQYKTTQNILVMLVEFARFLLQRWLCSRSSMLAHSVFALANKVELVQDESEYPSAVAIFLQGLSQISFNIAFPNRFLAKSHFPRMPQICTFHFAITKI